MQTTIELLSNNNPELLQLPLSTRPNRSPIFGYTTNEHLNHKTPASLVQPVSRTSDTRDRHVLGAGEDATTLSTRAGGADLKIWKSGERGLNSSHHLPGEPPLMFSKPVDEVLRNIPFGQKSEPRTIDTPSAVPPGETSTPPPKLQTSRRSFWEQQLRCSSRQIQAACQPQYSDSSTACTPRSCGRSRPSARPVHCGPSHSRKRRGLLTLSHTC